MENNTNEQEKTIAIDMYSDMINSIIELINTGYDENDGYDDIPEYHELNKKSFSLKTAIEMTDNDYIKTTLQNELEKINNDMAVIRKNDKNEYYKQIINAVMDKLELASVSRKSNVKKSNVSNEKTEKSAYTAKMAIMENVTNDWQTLKMICDSIEKQNKLPSIHTNDGWKRTISTAMISLIENGSVLRNDKHEYKLA